ELLGDRVAPLPDASWLVAGRGRQLVVGKGDAGSVPYFALQMQDAAHLEGYRNKLSASEGFSSLLLEKNAYAVTDPDGRKVVFGVPKESASADGLPGQIG